MTIIIHRNTSILLLYGGILLYYVLLVNIPKCLLLAQSGTCGHDPPIEQGSIFALGAAHLDNKSSSLPNFKGNCGTTWSKIGQAQWNLSNAINQRFTVRGNA